MDARPFERFIEDKPLLTSDILMSRLYNVKLDHRNNHAEKQVSGVFQKVSKFLHELEKWSREINIDLDLWRFYVF